VKDEEKGCCQTGRNAEQNGVEFVKMPPPVSGPKCVADHAVLIPAGRAYVGTEDAKIKDDGEAPLRRVGVKSFWMGATTVTNAEFECFVKSSGHVTEAERWGWSYVFWSNVPDHLGPTQAVDAARWWRRVEGANWRDIHGPGTADASWRPDHPVTHMSWNDASAYAAWVGGRLPSEAEWEHAARAGRGDVRFPWGDEEPDDQSFLPCNIWQGRFPENDLAKDGYAGTAPAASFEPNDYGLYNMAGNVWEWSADVFRIRSLKKQVRERASMPGFMLSKGGSFLCHRSYCYRYRIAARSGISPETTAAHQGFRVVWND